MLSHMLRFSCLFVVVLWLNSIPSSICTTTSLSIYPSMGTGSFHVLIIVSNAEIKHFFNTRNFKKRKEFKFIWQHRTYFSFFFSSTFLLPFRVRSFLSPEFSTLWLWLGTVTVTLAPLRLWFEFSHMMTGLSLKILSLTYNSHFILQSGFRSFWCSILSFRSRLMTLYSVPLRVW